MRKRAQRKSKEKVTFLFFLLLLIAWIFLGFNTNNADYGNYENAYNSFANGASNNYFEIGFYLLMRLCIILRLSYQGFLLFISAITLFIFSRSIKYLTNNRLLAFAFYFVYPFAFDIVQYRNFLGFAFVLYGIHYLLKPDKTIKNIILYLFFVLLGSSIHTSMLIYAIFIIAKIKSPRLVFGLSFIGFISLIFLITNQTILVSILSKIGLEKYCRYEIAGTLSTFIQYFLVYLALMIIVLFKFYYVDKIPSYEKINKKNSTESMILKILFLCICLLPFIIMNGTSARFIRNALIIFYSFIANSSYFVKIKTITFSRYSLSIKQVVSVSSGSLISAVNKEKYTAFLKNRIKFRKQWYNLFRLATFAIIAFVFYEQLMSGLYYDIVLIPILTCNLLW